LKKKFNKKGNTPPVGVFLSDEVFNNLIAVLSSYIETEKIVGITDYSKNSAVLEQKIMRYARKFIDRTGRENAAIYFFENEASVLIELLLSALSTDKKSPINYFKNIKENKKNFKQN
jgi:hypothetical protein